MKKLFTLIAAALMAVGANAEEKVVISTPITIEASAADKWGGSDVFTIAASDVAFGDFLKIYIGVAEAGEGERNVVQFLTKDDASVYYGSDFNPAANDVVTIPVNDAILAVLTGGFKFGGCIQQTSGSWSAVPGKKVVIDKISVVPATDYSVVSLYDEAVATSAAWTGVNMGKANFLIAKAGDIIVANFNADDATRNEGNFQFVLGEYTAGFWVVPPFAVINVTEELVTKMASGNFYYQGGKFPFTVTAKLYRQKDGLPTNETSLEVAATELGKWENSVSIAKDKFANVAAGDEIHVLISDWKSVQYDGENYKRTAQLQLKSGAEGNPALECSAEAADAAGVSEVVFILTATDVTTIQENGLVIGGQSAIINGVKLITAKAASEGGEEATGKTWDFTNLAAEVIAALEADAKWESSAQGSDESAFTRYSYTEEIAKDTYVDLGEIGFATGAGIEVGRAGSKMSANSIRVDANNRIQLNCSNGVFKIKNLKAGDVVKIQIASANSEEARTFTITNGDKTSVTTTGDGTKTEETITVSADGDLVLQQSKAINIYAIAVNAALPTGIQETVAPVKVINNGAIYNLAGQKVNENYKGIVIKNGKKFIQK